LEAIATGADVVVSARRSEALERVVADAGAGSVAVGDICDDDARDSIVRRAVAHLGQIDLVVYAVGFAQVRRLQATDAALWRATFDANVVALNQLVAAVLPHMAPSGVVAVLSSEAAAVPRAGLVHYAASKAALGASVRGWRVEHPEVRFTCVVIGATQPTDFGVSFDPAELDDAYASWVRHGLMQQEFMHTDDVAQLVVVSLAAALEVPGVGVEELVLRSPSPVVAPPDRGRRDGHPGRSRP
jgi:NADP-dependent 3-hydroxy acid dehydrogenase YdfG